MVYVWRYYFHVHADCNRLRRAIGSFGKTRHDTCYNLQSLTLFKITIWSCVIVCYNFNKNMCFMNCYGPRSLVYQLRGLYYDGLQLICVLQIQKAAMRWCRLWAGRLLSFFPTFVPEFKNDKIPNSLCSVGWGRGIVDHLSNFCF